MTVFVNLISRYTTHCTVEENDDSYIINPFTKHGDGTKTHYVPFKVSKEYEGYEYRIDRLVREENK